jgi:hypothetical protein
MLLQCCKKDENSAKIYWLILQVNNLRVNIYVHIVKMEQPANTS